MMPRNDASQAQVRAARPDVSTWLAANAGSGKTRVLTDRVARLLLDGVQPQNILCLTYTKAAASEMQNRLFKRLGEWAMLEDSALRSELLNLGIEQGVDGQRLRSARTLFARAIEAPGGLKIQTIHSFCAALLRRFPLEARVSPQFTEIEDRSADILRAETVDTMAEGEDQTLVADLARHFTGEDFSSLTRAIVRNQQFFSPPLKRAEVLGLFDQPADLDGHGVERAAFIGGEADLLQRILPALLAKGGNDEKAGRRLQGITTMSMTSLPLLEDIFLTGAAAKQPFTAKIGSFPTKDTRQVIAGDLPALEDFMSRIEDTRSKRLALMAAERSLALHNFADRFLHHYANQKTLRGWLDFDDLIFKARDLLSDPKVAAWVLFRIDGGIDHILVDEAQDTSPAQWDVVRRLAAEFTSGDGARDNMRRTLFVVGDKKQSIYSFQGADPKEFDRMQSEFQEKFEAAQQEFQNLSLLYSFRSSSAILWVVDETFARQKEAGFSAQEQHRTFKADLPGRVDLWPLIEPQDENEDREWHEPLDRASAQHHSVLLADQIARQIERMVDGGETIPQDITGGHAKRPVRYGDFLILVQSRNRLFSEIIRACKKYELPIAGADRLKVGGELAVRDIAALLSFLATPEDSLSLASALKSPLFGWSEQDLFDLAHCRETTEHLWQALRRRLSEFPKTMNVLRDLRDNVDFLRPYDLIERILTRHDGRRKLIGRLGQEAEDGINALLSQALAYERTAVPSLTGFLVWMETDDLEIKRQIDNASDQIRVMTVHGAKGLEAPIVILPDTGPQRTRIRDEIVQIKSAPTWKTRADEMPPSMAEAVDALKASDANERLRLLYVALTRAEKWLIIAAAGTLSNQGDSWYQLVGAAMGQVGATETAYQDLVVKRVSHADWDTLPDVTDVPIYAPEADLPTFFRRAAPPAPQKTSVISPSNLGGAKALPGELGWDEDAAKTYGTLVHHYIEHLSKLPASGWSAHLDDLALVLPLSPAERAARAEAEAVLKNPDLAPFFKADWMSEVPLTAKMGSQTLYGKIDQLIVEKHRVLAIDFKTNRTVPQSPQTCPEGLLRQMGAYAHALGQIYPDRRIDTGIIWTSTAHFMALPHETVRQALQKTPYLDAAGGGS